MTAFVQTGKNGDQLSILPILLHEYRTTGEKPVIVVSKEYSSVVAGLDFLTPCVVDSHWQDLDAAVKFAKQNFPIVKVPQTFGKLILERRRASFQLDQWDRCGVYHLWDKLPLELPRRVCPPGCNTWPRGKFILLGDHSQSSPFERIDELHGALVKHFPSHQIVRLSSIRASSLLDLLVLYDAAELIVTIETVHIHLSKATSTPTIVLATDKPSKWHGSAGSLKFAFYCHYDEFDSRLGFLLKTAKRVIGKKFRGHDKFTVRRTGAIGDAIAASVVVKRMNDLGYKAEFQTHKDIHCAIRRMDVPLSDGHDGMAHVVLDGAYENHPKRREKHFHQMFMEKANFDLSFYGIDIGTELNCKPVMKCEPFNIDDLMKYPKPWIMVCPRSDSHACRTVPDAVWSAAAAKFNGTSFWIGRHKAPKNFVDLECRHFDNVIKYLSVADLYVGVDTGPSHIAISLGIPSIIIGQASDPVWHFSDRSDWTAIYP